MTISLRRITAVTALAAGVSLFGLGCSSTSTVDEIRGDLTPELVTLHERQDDMDNTWALQADENGRMFMQDLGRVFYTNRASRLTPEPLPRP